MIGCYIRNRLVVIITWTSCIYGYSARDHMDINILSQLREKIMQSWLEINTARAISPYDVEVFYHRIIKAHLELYATLCMFVKKGNIVFEDIMPVYRVLKGLYISHQAWLVEQKSSVAIGAYYLMCAIMRMWCFATKDILSHENELLSNILECKEQAELCGTTP